jgi:hypothetical protein
MTSFLEDFVLRDFPDERQKAMLRRSPERVQWARRDVMRAAPCAFFPFAEPSRGLNSSVWPKSMNGSRCPSAIEPGGSTACEAKRRLPLATPKGTPPKTVPNFPSSVSLRDAAAPPCSPCRSRCSRIRRRLSKAVDGARPRRRGANGRLFSRLGSRFRSRPCFAGAARARYTRHDFAGTAAKTSLRIRSFAIQRRR